MIKLDQFQQQYAAQTRSAQYHKGSSHDGTIKFNPKCPLHGQNHGHQNTAHPVNIQQQHSSPPAFHKSQGINEAQYIVQSRMRQNQAQGKLAKSPM